MDTDKARRKKSQISSIVQVLSDYCQNTTIHGIQYWISAGTVVERVLWVGIVCIGFATAFTLVSSAIQHWIDVPSKVTITTFSMPATEVPYPAITICNKNGKNVGEYLRAVFDNFQYACSEYGGDCEKTKLLRSHFPTYDQGASNGFKKLDIF